MPSNKTRKNVSNKRKTVKSRGPNGSQTYIIEIFLGMLNTVKLYHWKTFSFSEHKATDELYENLNTHIDKFVEILLGKTETRIKSFSSNGSIAAFNDTKKSDFKSRVYEYRKFLINMNGNLDSRRDTDLLSVRDDILGDINKFLYLLTFNM